MTRYRTRAGDVLDAIAKRYYGRESAAVAVMEANPGLADRGPIYPAGVIIDLPRLAPPTAAPPPIRLWD